MAHKAHICVERHKKQVTSISWVMERGRDRANIPLIPSLCQQDHKKRPDIFLQTNLLIMQWHCDSLKNCAFSKFLWIPGSFGRPWHLETKPSVSWTLGSNLHSRFSLGKTEILGTSCKVLTLQHNEDIIKHYNITIIKEDASKDPAAWQTEEERERQVPNPPR